LSDSGFFHCNCSRRVQSGPLSLRSHIRGFPATRGQTTEDRKKNADFGMENGGGMKELEMDGKGPDVKGIQKQMKTSHSPEASKHLSALGGLNIERPTSN
jgi:hypothetical protein